jgi:lipoprotein NlpI
MKQSCVRVVLTACCVLGTSALSATEPPASERDTEKLTPGLTERVTRLTAEIAGQPEKFELYSQRGDALFFLGKFAEAVADYDRMVELDAKQDASHWRRGIALFYAERYRQAAGQFERYHSFDNVDRENGIWRYLSQAKAYGKERARQDLLKYEKDDREPFPDLYRLFAGTIMPDEVLQHIAEARIDDRERDKRLFYAHLYVGLNCAIENEPEAAREHLAKAAASTWAESAGYGPRYMQHVARLHRDLLDAAAAKQPQP